MWNKDYKRLKSDADIVILHRSLWKDNDSQIYKTGTACGMIKFSDSTLFSLFDMARWMELPLISYYSLAVPIGKVHLALLFSPPHTHWGKMVFAKTHYGFSHPMLSIVQYTLQTVVLGNNPMSYKFFSWSNVVHPTIMIIFFRLLPLLNNLWEVKLDQDSLIW